MLVRDVGEQAAEGERRRHVDARGGLVGDDHRRPGREGPRNGDALTLTRGQELREPVGVFTEADRDERIDRPLVGVDPLDPPDREPQLHVLARREESREPGRLADERDRVAPEAGASLPVERRDRVAPDQDLTFVRDVEARR